MSKHRGRLDLSHFHDIASDNPRGLVPMEFVQHAMPYSIGDVAGFKPANAKKLHDDGTAVPHASVYDRGDVQERQDASQVEETEEDRRRSAVDLGDAPLDAHHLVKIRLAGQITGGKVETKEEAEKILRDELDRRGRITPKPPIMTSGDLRP